MMFILLASLLYSLLLKNVFSAIQNIPTKITYSPTAILPISAPTPAPFVTWGQRRNIAYTSPLGTVYTTQEYYDTVTSTTKLTTPVALPTTGVTAPTAAFGTSLDAGYSLLAHEMLLVGNPITGAIGSAYVFKHNDRQWSQIQKLVPHDGSADDAFGQVVSIDIHDPTTAAIAAPNRITYTKAGTSFTGGGGVYTFESSASGTGWTQTQRLYPSNPVNDLNFGSDVEIMGNVLSIASSNIPTPAPSPTTCYFYLYQQEEEKHDGDHDHHYFQRSTESEDVLEKMSSSDKTRFYAPYLDINMGRYAKWSEQQVLTYAPCSVPIDTTVYEDNIAVGYSDGNRVDVYKSFLFRYLCPPSPSPCEKTLWTRSQILYGADGITGIGKSIEMYEDVMAVTSSSHVTLFQRYKGAWTYLSTLTVANVDKVSVAGTDVTIATATDLITYVADSTWKCLIVSIGDQFGDGWGGADLVISGSDLRERYVPRCLENRNPDSFRWCPDQTESEVASSYTFEIPHALSYPFHWEMYWTVDIESTRAKIIATPASKMTFTWDALDHTMYLKDARRVFENDTCDTCPERPTLKPTPAPKMVPLTNSQHQQRILKSRPTHLPTTSVHPTLSVSMMDDWQNMELLDMSNQYGWWEIDNRGTKYYISTEDGKHLITEGQLCPNAPGTTCWQDLPEPGGNFILRVGGALNEHTDEVVWKFCYATGVAMEQLKFRVAGSDGSFSSIGCAPLFKYTATDYCSEFATATVRLNGYFELAGIRQALTSEDYHLIEGALSSIFRASGGHVADCHVSLQRINYDAIILGFGINVPISSFSDIDPLDLQAWDYAYSNATTRLQEAIAGNEITRYIIEHSNSGSSSSQSKVSVLASYLQSHEGQLQLTLVDVHEGSEVKFMYSDATLEDEARFEYTGVFGSSSHTQYGQDEDASSLSWLSGATLVVSGCLLLLYVARRVMMKYAREDNSHAEEDKQQYSAANEHENEDEGGNDDVEEG